MDLEIILGHLALSQRKLLIPHRSLTRKPPQTFPHQDSPGFMGQLIFECKSEIVHQSDYNCNVKKKFASL